MIQKRFRLTRNNITGRLRFEEYKMNPRNEMYWEVHPEVPPQDEPAAIRRLAKLNMVEKWEVIA